MTKQKTDIRDLTKTEQQIEQAIHDWYTERWNTFYADSSEPGWAISNDITLLLSKMSGQPLTAKNVAAKLQEIAKLDLS